MFVFFGFFHPISFESVENIVEEFVFLSCLIDECRLRVVHHHDVFNVKLCEIVVDFELFLLLGVLGLPADRILPEGAISLAECCIILVKSVGCNGT